MFACSRLRALAILACALPGAFAACGTSGAPSTTPRPERAPREQTAGAVSTVTAADLGVTRAARVEELLMARVPGLEVMRDGGGDYRLRIRGSRSFYGSDEPLLVIDGMPIRQGGMSRALMGIHPADVARIDVLKDAAAASSYGVLGANGVILITTRKR